MMFGYSINLDERGLFAADVRDEDGVSVYEIAQDEDGEIDLIMHGFMRHTRDLEGLRQALVQIGVLEATDRLLPLAEQERAIAYFAAQHRREWAHERIDLAANPMATPMATS